MKKTKLVALALFGTFIFTGCGADLNSVMAKNSEIKTGMTIKDVKELLEIEPTMKKRNGNFEVWVYEGKFTNKDTEETKYKNITIKFKNGVVVYPAYFECPVPKIKD